MINQDVGVGLIITGYLSGLWQLFSCLVLTCWWLVFPINCQQARRFVELACTIEILKEKRFPMRIILFKSTFAPTPQLWPGGTGPPPAMASLSYYAGGEWTNFPYESEPRKPRIKVWVDFYPFPPFWVCVFLLGKRGGGDPFKESFWLVSWDW